MKLSARLYRMAKEAEEICHDVTTDYRVRDGLFDAASILKFTAYTQAKIESGTIRMQLDRPMHLHD